MTAAPPVPLVLRAASDSVLTRAAPPRFVLIGGNGARELLATLWSCLPVAAQAEIEFSDDSVVDVWPDGESHVEIRCNLRGREVFIFQSKTAHATTASGVALQPAHLFTELLLLISAAKRADAAHVTVVVPAMFFARQDKKDTRGVPIAAADATLLMHAQGATRIVTVDLHAGQTQGSALMPYDNLYAAELLQQHMRAQIAEDVAGGAAIKHVIISPDAGGKKRADAYAAALGVPCFAADKLRGHAGAGAGAILSSTLDLGTHGPSEVSGAVCFAVDDMVDTGGSLVSALLPLKAAGAREARIYVTHGFFSTDPRTRLSAMDLLGAEPFITEVVVTDSVLLPRALPATFAAKLRVVSLAPMLAEAVMNLMRVGGSLSSLFKPKAADAGKPPAA